MRAHPIAFLCALSVFSLFQGTASLAAANNDKPPSVELRVRGVEGAQKANRYSSDWLDCEAFDGQVGCTGKSADGPREFPAPFKTPSEDVTARFVIHKPEEPDDVIVEAWRNLDRNGTPIGPVPTDVELVPKPSSSAQKRWIVKVSTAPSRHLYFDLFGRWRDQVATEETESASWTMHLRRGA